MLLDARKITQWLPNLLEKAEGFLMNELCAIQNFFMEIGYMQAVRSYFFAPR
jgi:hypothetical protein